MIDGYNSLSRTNVEVLSKSALQYGKLRSHNKVEWIVLQIYSHGKNWVIVILYIFCKVFNWRPRTFITLE